MATSRKRKGEIFENLKPYFRRAMVRLREARGSSREKVAKEAGMDPGTLGRLEQGDAPLREDYIAGIGRALGISLEDVLRTAADCYLEEQKGIGSSPQDYSTEELIQKKQRVYDARARADRELWEIELELQRRQILRR